jgi:hypothetical protein
MNCDGQPGRRIATIPQARLLATGLLRALSALAMTSAASCDDVSTHWLDRNRLAMFRAESCA